MTLRAFALGGTALLALSIARPAEAERLDLREAMALAQRHAPEVQSAREGVRAHQSVRAAAGGLALPPRLELAAGPRWIEDGDRGLDVTVGVWQDLPLAGVGAAREKHANASVMSARAELSRTQRDAAARGGHAWIEARLGWELIRIQRRAVADAKELVRIARARVDAGAALPSELALTRSLLGRARAELLAAEGRHHVASIRLGALTGQAEGTTSGPLDAPDTPLPDEASLLRHALSTNPHLRAARAAPVVANASAERALAESATPLAIGPSVSREATGDWVVLGRVSLPLPLVQPGRYEAARQRATAAIGRAELTRQRRELVLATRLALHERKHARETRDTLKHEALEPAREGLRETTRRYEAGDVDLATVLYARREMLAAEQRWAEAAAEVRRADVELWRITGLPRQLGALR